MTVEVLTEPSVVDTYIFLMSARGKNETCCQLDFSCGTNLFCQIARLNNEPFIFYCSLIMF